MEDNQTDTFRGMTIPAHMIGAIQRYLNHGISPGGFLKAVIINDLEQSVSRADAENIKLLPAYVAYFYNECPNSCWGSVEKYNNWMNKFLEAQDGSLSS